MSDNKQLELLQGIFAPFDMKAWERFREWDPEAAAYLLDAVRAGVTAEQIRDYGQANGYSPQAINWLGHAAAWLGRALGDTGTVVEPPPAPAGPPRRGKRIIDTTSDTVTTVSYRYETPPVIGGAALRPPGRTTE